MADLQNYYRDKVSQAGYDLFAVFARFEYAMKKGGFRRENHAEAAWRTFADTLPAGFFAQMQAAPQVAIYFAAPPDHLVTDAAGGVRWSGAPISPTTTAELFGSINTARNNLFHGDKQHDRQRDTDLMVAALFVLNAAYDAAEGDARFIGFVSEMAYGL
ncbi:hypothetical protein NKI71_14840 [Mesorhizobium sp. M0510]|uniref:hypothetical protein n=1 Tax=Mesorhizobium sp. M0510 TaxID=2956954 RepID=UPI00333B63DB